MSFYNILMGFNPACVLIMPMLGRKQEEKEVKVKGIKCSFGTASGK